METTQGICSFTGKKLDKHNRYYSQDGTYMDVNVRQFLDEIPDLPVEALEHLIAEASKARKVKLTPWRRFLKVFKIVRV